jgi:copper chaperone
MMTIEFTVSGMSCQHCVSAVTKAIQTIDNKAQVTVNLNTQVIQIKDSTADLNMLKAAVQEEGFKLI